MPDLRKGKSHVGKQLAGLMNRPLNKNAECCERAGYRHRNNITQTNESKTNTAKQNKQQHNTTQHNTINQTTNRKKERKKERIKERKKKISKQATSTEGDPAPCLERRGFRTDASKMQGIPGIPQHAGFLFFKNPFRGGPRSGTHPK